jgi:hypothetical protein
MISPKMNKARKEYSMKNLFRLFGLIALIAVIGFSMAACGGDDDGGGSNTATYTGKSGGTTYTLKITENTTRYTAQSGDAYVLTAGSNTSKGMVDSFENGVFTLIPSNAPTSSFTVTVSGSSITSMNNTITWTDNTTASAPGEFTGGGGGGGGMAWTAVANSPFGTSDIFAVAYGGDKFVAVGKDGKTAYSSDGINWTGKTITNKYGSTSNFSAIAYGNGMFVSEWAFSIMYSSDGIDWTEANISGGSSKPHINSIAYGGGKFVGVGMGAASNIATSTDGINWSTVLLSDVRSINAVAYGNGMFVAAGESPDVDIIILTSTDGTNWTNIPVDLSDIFLSFEINVIAFGNGKFVAGSLGRMATSTDGAKWSGGRVNVFSSFTIGAITFDNGKFVAGNSIGVMGTSTDGTTWTGTSNSTFGMDSINSIAYGNGKFVAVGDKGKMAYSSEGGTGGGTNPGTGGNGTLTVTDIPAKYNGKYAAGGGLAEGEDITIMGYQSINNSNTTYSRISNGQVIIPVWLFNDGTYVRYSGNAAFFITLSIYEVGTSTEYAKDPSTYALVTGAIRSVKFTNGSATVSKNDAALWTELK